MGPCWCNRLAVFTLIARKDKAQMPNFLVNRKTIPVYRVGGWGGWLLRVKELYGQEELLAERGEQYTDFNNKNKYYL